MKKRLPTPQLTVYMRDGSEHTVQAFNVDLVSWDRERARHNWPKADEAPFMWMEYLAWHALCKTQGLLPAMKLSEFGEAVASITSAVEDEEGDELGVDPTSSEVEVD